MLRGVVACLAVLAGTSLLVYGTSFKKREVTVKEESKTVIPAPPVPAFVVQEALREGRPPPARDPARVVVQPPVRQWDLEPLLVRNVTVGALEMKADGLHRNASLADGPALCPT